MKNKRMETDRYIISTMYSDTSDYIEVIVFDKEDNYKPVNIFRQGSK